MNEAQSRAEQILAAAQQQAAGIREQARREGFAEGMVAGRAELRELGEPAVQALSEAVEQIREMASHATEAVEHQAVVLAMDIAEKVVAGAIAVEPERVLDVVRGALRAIVERERLVILVNPEDLDILREGLDELTGSLGGVEHVEVQEERRVMRGGAVIRTAVGEIDANIRTKLDRAREAVEKDLGS
ncbi:MAG: flagellar assembly protein FliH [Thermoleophilaceae bacterium]|jgi:flagellar assembly protein FliH|nr:flagellar assembly protein FliH [Thermoleophilaceae bacterium]